MPSLDLRHEWTAHPYAEQMPAMNADEVALLARDIAANGMRSPIVTYAGRVLDGRNRLRALAILRARREWQDSAPAVEFTGDSVAAWRFVISANAVRRQMGASQRALSAALMRAQSPVPIQQQEVAAQFGITDRYVREAERLLEHASPQRAALLDQVHAGEMNLREALRIADGVIGRVRPVAIEPMPDNPALAAEPVLVGAEGDSILRAAVAMVRNPDPTAWLRSLPTGLDAMALAAALETFGRIAVDMIADERGLPAPVGARDDALAHGHSPAAAALAAADALALRLGTTAGDFAAALTAVRQSARRRAPT